MTLLDFVKLLLSYKKWLLTVPIVVAGLVFALTISQPKTYVSQALLYTGVVPTSDGTVNVQARVDVFAVNNAIDNIQTIITSRLVLEETSLHLLAKHIHKKRTDPKSIEKSIAKFMDEHHEDFKSLPSGESEEIIFKALTEKDYSPNLRWLLEDEASIYAIQKIKSGLKIKRSGSSDLLEVIYTTSEASIARATLYFLVDAFTKRFKEIRKTEMGSTVQFFEKEVAKASGRLAKCAADMKDFQMKFRLINYQEQTHLIAIETEHLNGQYYDELMKLAASERAYQDLSSKLGDPVQQALSSDAIVKTQQSIANLMTKKQLLKSSSTSYQIINDSIQQEEKSLRKAINQLYVDGRTEEGVSKKDILRQWLDQFIALSEARARVVVMDKRKIEQQKEYDYYAPLGSVLHNYERQMDVAEREYLDLLHSLNQARLRQQSAESASLLATVDPPNDPLKPEPSKRKLLVIIGWLGSFVVIMGVALFLEYFDSTLQSPERAENKTGLTVLGATTKDTNTPIGKIASSNLMLRFLANVPSEKNKPRKIVVIAKSAEVSSLNMATHFAQFLKSQNEQVALSGVLPEGYSEFPVLTTSELTNTDHSFDSLLGVLPSLQHAATEYTLLKNIEDIILITAGEHTWTSADSQSVDLLQKITGRKPFLVLVGVDERRLEHWLGELPKERSKIRKIIKKVIQFQFTQL